jgi:hypothetical protein
VWYLLKTEPNYTPTDNLILTAANYFDWYASDWMDPKHGNHQRLLSSYETAKTNHSAKIITDPYDYAATHLADYEILQQTHLSFQAAERCLNEMLVGIYDTKQITNIRKACSASKTRFAAHIRKNNQFLHAKCSDKKKSFESRRYQLNSACVITNIKMWIMTFPGFDKKNMDDIKWDEMNIFIGTYYKFLNNKPNSPKANSMIDLLNFLYLIHSGNVYWSEEKEFLELVRQSFGNKIPDFIYPHGKIVNQIFN